MSKLVKVNIQVKEGLDVKNIVSLLTSTGATNLSVNGSSVSAVVGERLLGNLKANSAVSTLSSTAVAEVKDEAKSEPVKSTVPPLPVAKPAPEVVVVPDRKED